VFLSGGMYVFSSGFTDLLPVLAALPTLDVNEGALDKIFAIYKKVLPGLGGYLTDGGDLNRPRLECLLQELAALETETLAQRAAVSPNSFCWTKSW
jgi:5'-3' exonuclease